MDVDVLCWYPMLFIPRTDHHKLDLIWGVGVASLVGLPSAGNIIGRDISKILKPISMKPVIMCIENITGRGKGLFESGNTSSKYYNSLVWNL